MKTLHLYWCYEVFCGDRKLKNIFEKIIYKVWKSVGVSPSKLMIYYSSKYEYISSDLTAYEAS